MSNPENHLIIFVKAPRPGTVKTRLAHSLGGNKAAAAYAQLVETLVKNLSRLKHVELRHTPDDAEEEIRPWLQSAWEARPQGGGDLGARMEAAFAEAFARGARRVVLIGSDCPEIKRGDIQEAHVKLKTHEVVLGPSLDGGYWLIGLNRPWRELFQGIPWSSSQVLGETLEKVRAGHGKVHLLRILTDIDTESEWRSYVSGNKTGG